MATAAADGGATKPSESLGPGPPPSYPALCHAAEASVFGVQAQGLSPPWFSDSTLPPKILWRRGYEPCHSSPRMEKVGRRCV